ncbi:hypothetical protein, partial [Burkholderia pseudomallei]|uniref:hypothetical protein n=1 Tax=Burkholderia pseudomallei TaxID=28450 RepID=UPI001CA4AC8C
MRDVVRERRGARIDQRVVDDDFAGDAQPVLARAVLQAGERARRVPRRRPRFGGPVRVRAPARATLAAAPDVAATSAQTDTRRT